MPFFKRKPLHQIVAQQPESGATASRRLRVLLIDENATARAVIARRLSRLNYDVVLAENGFIALNLLVTRPVDLILIDMDLLMLPAVATMKRIRATALAPHACIVMLTGRIDSQSAVEVLEAGADDHIVKPFDFDLLDARLRAGRGGRGGGGGGDDGRRGGGVGVGGVGLRCAVDGDTAPTVRPRQERARGAAEQLGAPEERALTLELLRLAVRPEIDAPCRGRD